MHPILRLIALSIGTLGFFFTGGILLKSCGNAQVYEKKSHVLLNQDFPVIAIRGGALEAPENTFAAFDEAQKLKCWIHFDLRLTKDDHLIVMRDSTLDRTTDGKGYVREFTLEQIRKLPQKVPTVEDMLERYKDSVLLIEIQDNYPFAGEHLVDLVTQRNMQDKIIFMSPNPKMMSELRRFRPEWLTVSSPDELERLVLLSSLGVQGIANMYGDFVMSQAQVGSVRLLPEFVITELHRRFKKVFLWNVNNKPQLETARKMNVDGIATEAPKLLRGI
jgi:glycerophosphoryl diester phosphodiesterase